MVIGRYFGIVCSYYMFSCFKGSDSNYLSLREISFATYAAFIRGAIAFGLVELLDENTFQYKRVIVSSTMVLVISSTCIFGGFTPIVLNFLLPSKNIEITNIDANLISSEPSSKHKTRGSNETAITGNVENIFNRKTDYFKPIEKQKSKTISPHEITEF